MSSSHFYPRDVAMKDSWSHGDDRRDRGRVDRGMNRSRRSPSPLRRRPETDREDNHRDRGTKSASYSDSKTRHRDHSEDRRRRVSRSPTRDSREDFRERNRGRELLDTRGTTKPRREDHREPSSAKRHKSRSPSRDHHHKKSRRERSRSTARSERDSGLPRSERSRREQTPESRSVRRRDSPHKSEHSRGHHKSVASEKRLRSVSLRRDRHRSRDRVTSPKRNSEYRKRSRSPQRPSDRGPAHRHRSSPPPQHPSRKEARRQIEGTGRQTPEIDRYEPPRSRPSSPPRGPRRSRGPSPAAGSKKAQSSRKDDYRPPQGRRNSDRPPTAASGANSIEISDAKMAGRGGYGPQQGYHNPNQQMQAAFPLKPQFNQGPGQRPQIDTRQYSQSPGHMTPNSSYHGSPQAQSPYSGGRGGWGGQQQFSPQHQYQPNYPQGGYGPPNGPQGHYYPQQNHSPPYQGPNGPMQHGYPPQNFRGNGRGYRGNQYSPPRGGGYRGRGGHFQNLHWNANNQGGAGRGQGQHNNHSGSVTPQHTSPQFPSQPTSQQASPQPPPPPPEKDDDDEDLFRPSKDLQVEDTSKKADDEEKMPPPSRPPPSGPQSSKFSFAFKASSKAPPTAPKPEISQKLNAAPIRQDPLPPRNESERPVPRPIPTEPSSARARMDNRHPREPPPTTRKVKKVMKRLKPRPTLPTEFAASDSVYYRKPGNESVVGSGTYGKVFKAIHVYTKKLVALKKIRMEGERDGFPVTAVREIKLLQSLKHDNIVHLQEVMVEKNDCFMVFEYLSHDLTGLLNHPSFKLEPAHKKHLAKQLFDGLDYLHRRGVLHRDIKAANILVSNEGQLKLADFGLARFYAKRRQLDYTNRVITIWYRSPELLLGETQYGPAVDIWSAACVLVEIFTRHAIFPGDGGEISQLDKIYAILGTPNIRDWPGLVDMAWFELLRPTAKRPNVFAEKYKDRVTPAAYELLEAMFQYDPAKRPTASDVLEHPYFTTEEPAPKQAIELQTLEGDWHEFESKALRKENERRDKEARRAQQKEKDKEATSKEKEKKRAPEGDVTDRDAKRQQTTAPGVVAPREATEATTKR